MEMCDIFVLYESEEIPRGYGKGRKVIKVFLKFLRKTQLLERFLFDFLDLHLKTWLLLVRGRET